MRISDWSSDVCSSDLTGKPIKKALEAFVNKEGTVVFYGAATNAKTDEDGAGILGEQCGMIDWYQYLPARDKQIGRASCRERVSVRVDLGGRRIIKKNKTKAIKSRDITQQQVRK